MVNKDRRDEMDREVNESPSLKEIHLLLLALKAAEPGDVAASRI